MRYQPALAVIISTLADQHGWNKTELAKRSGYSRSYVTSLMDGSCVPTLDGARAVLGALGQSLPQILHNIELYDAKVATGEVPPVALPEKKPKKITASISKAKELSSESSLKFVREATLPPAVREELEVEERSIARSLKYTTKKRQKNTMPPENRSTEYRKRAQSPSPSAQPTPEVETMVVTELLEMVDLAYLPSKAKGLPYE